MNEKEEFDIHRLRSRYKTMKIIVGKGCVVCTYEVAKTYTRSETDLL